MEPQLEDFELRKEASCRIVLMTPHCLIARIPPTGAVAEIKESEMSHKLQHSGTLHNTSRSGSTVFPQSKT